LTSAVRWGAQPSGPLTTGSGANPPIVSESPAAGSPTPGGSASPAPRQFFGTVELDANLAKKNFADIVDEVVLNFTAKHGVNVRIKVDIEAETATGFDDALQRIVRENCNVLKFRNAEFE
jgi:uncharacterized protein